jgi:hypothetical protein
MIQGIIQILKDSTVVVSAVGQNEDGNKPKVYPVVCPQKEEAPYITVHETSKPPIRCKGTRPTDYNFTANVICYADSYEKVNRMADAVESSVDSTKGTFAGVTFKDLRYETRQDAFDNEAGLYLKIVQLAGQI